MQLPHQELCHSTHLVLPEWRQPDAACIPVAILQGGRRGVRHQESGLVDAVCVGVCGPGAQDDKESTRYLLHILETSQWCMGKFLSWNDPQHAAAGIMYEAAAAARLDGFGGRA